MSSFAAAFLAGVTSFIATNIDDIVILMLFFSQVNSQFSARHIVLGQYLGFVALILVSLPGFFGGLLLPKAWIGVLGVVPIAIGLWQLWHDDDEETVQTVAWKVDAAPRRSSRLLATLLAPQTYHVAAVTIANGGDNIGIYVSLFASSTLSDLMVILIVFLILVGVWCFVADYLSRHPAIAPILSRYGRAIVPYVLIGLGIYILIENETYRLLSILRS